MDIFNTRTSQSQQVLGDIQLHHTSVLEDSTGRKKGREGREREEREWKDKVMGEEQK